ncbi:hypothetical protein BS78_02G210300 [Paspalum vaginatum]|nr:hypothetical protein BS78_02G210300 [Paspalum vaginatum]
MHMSYEANKPQGSNRSQLAVQGRWGTIQKALNRFCGIKSAIDRRNESRKNEQDRIDDAVKVFEEKETFSFMHPLGQACRSCAQKQILPIDVSSPWLPRLLRLG